MDVLKLDGGGSYYQSRDGGGLQDRRKPADQQRTALDGEEERPELTEDRVRQIVREELAAQEAKLANAPADGWALEFIRQAVQENILSGVDDGQGRRDHRQAQSPHHQAGTGHHGCGHPSKRRESEGSAWALPSLFIRSETQYMRSATNPPGPLPVWHAPQR